MSGDVQGHRGVDVGGDKESDKARVDRAAAVSSQAKGTPAYTGDPAFKAVIDNYLAANATLVSTNNGLAEAKARVAKARSDRDVARLNNDRAYAVVISNVENRSTSPADIRSYGLNPAQPAVRATVVAPPESMTLKLDPKTGTVKIAVKVSGTVRGVLIEMTTDPSKETSWKALDGLSLRRSVAGLPAGTYWFRAAVQGGSGKSDYTTAMQIVVH